MSTSARPARRRRATRTPSRDIQEALVDAAETVLIREGPGAVTVRAVAQEAGVAPMGVYSRFGSKEGLVEALLLRGFERLRQAVAAHGELDPIERLRASGVRYRQFALENPQHFAVMFGSAIAPGEYSPPLAASADTAFEELVGHVATAMAAGRLITGDPSDVAQQILSAVHGAVNLEMQGRNRTADPEANYLALLDLIVRGLETT
jgi:AcrR family transcriptional regulator